MYEMERLEARLSKGKTEGRTEEEKEKKKQKQKARKIRQANIKENETNKRTKNIKKKNQE